MRTRLIPVLVGIALPQLASAQVVPQVGTKVALIGASSNPNAHKDVVDQIMCATRGVGLADTDATLPRAAYEIARIDIFDVSTPNSVPLVSDLEDYDALLVYNDIAFPDRVAVGDLVASLVENGKGVVLAGNAFDSAQGLQGRFLLQNQSPVTFGVAASPGGPLQIDAADADVEWLVGPTTGNIIDWGVIVIDGGAASYQVQGLSALPSAEITHRWSNFELAVVTLEPDLPGHGKVAAVNLMPPSSAVDPNGWNVGTHGAKLLGNTLLWTQDFTRPIGVCVDDLGPQVIAPINDPMVPATMILCRVDTDCFNTTGRMCAFSQNLSLFQDLNCNGVDVFTEPLFDPNIDPQCLANTDPVTGQPYDNNDYYHDFYRFVCDYVTDGFDADVDLLSAGTVTVMPDGNPQTWESIALTCDNCGDYYNPNQYDWDFDGTGDLCDDCPYFPELVQSDIDTDCFGDVCDNCIFAGNPDQWDQDDDGDGDSCDNCIDDFNPSVFGPGTETQPDWDFDGVGDACDNCVLRDLDGDGELENPGYPDGVADTINPDQIDSDADMWGDACDNCDFIPNPQQGDNDSDLVGNPCDNCPGVQSMDIADRDNDGLGDPCDSCDLVPNIDQLDLDLDAVGDACDNCPVTANEDQSDLDADGVGEVCDICPGAFDPSQSDSDADTVGDACDNCPFLRNTDQDDRDSDGVGDDCDACLFFPDPENLDSDGDGLGDACDNCPYYVNFDQADDDRDTIGNACDVFGIRGGGEVRPPACETTPGPAGLFGGLLVAMAVIGRRRRG